MSIMRTYRKENILVFPARILIELGYFQGLSKETERHFDVILSPENIMFKPRQEAELDTNFKQIIPYVILRYENSVFRYTRGKHFSEKRLEGKYSIGIGGHISQRDVDLFSAFTSTYYDIAVDREVTKRWQYLRHTLITVSLSLMMILTKWEGYILE